MAVLSVSLLFATPWLGASTAHGDPIGDKKHQAEQIAARLEDLQQQVEREANAYEAARQRLARLEAAARVTRAQIARANVELSRRRHDLAVYALNSYVTAGESTAPGAILTDSQARHDARRGYTTATMGNRQQLVDDLTAAQQIARDQVARLDAQERDAKAAEAQAAARRRSADGAAQAQAELYSQVQGELKQLVEAKQEADRKAAEAAAYAQAQREAAARAAAIPPPPSAAPVGASAGAPSPAQPEAPASSPPATPPPSSSGDASLGARAVAAAETKLGAPYVWGASGPGAFDCSGLTQWAYAQVGVSLPRVTWDQENAGRRMPLSQIQPGDLVFYIGGDHMAMYVGGSTVIHAPYTGSYVKYGSLYMYPPELVVRPY